MKEQLTKYVELLFAGAPNARDIQQEILQNTLDRYDDLISQGKSPEAAYSLSISGIGDLSEILGSNPHQSTFTPASEPAENPEDALLKKKRKAAAIAFYILCPVPLFILSEFGLDTMGLCLTLLLVAAATALLVMNGKDKPIDDNNLYTAPAAPSDPETAMGQETRKNIRTIIWCIGIAAYFIMSVATDAWYITWIAFPLIACIQGLTTAILDLKEAG